MSLVISEVLADPVGKDTEGEFIEIYNNSEGRIFLDEYSLSDKSGKSFNLFGVLEPYEFKVFYYNDTHISINNGEEVIYLKKNGEAVGEVEIIGSQEGMSLSLVGEDYVFTETVTPGTESVFESLDNFTNRDVIDNSSLEAVIWVGVLVSLFFGFIVWLVYRLMVFDE